ncbi:MAG: Gfo/Idh/MocA family oxidoreductase, partial [bacterium]|nr:Gfo/Idh/MocA family oxidoreductase [bacterium]
MGPWKDPIGVGIIGCGDGGRSNARGLQGIKEARIVAFCDPNEERLAAAVQEFDSVGYHDFTAMLDAPNVDLVVVATPDDQHLA